MTGLLPHQVLLRNLAQSISPENKTDRKEETRGKSLVMEKTHALFVEVVGSYLCSKNVGKRNVINTVVLKSEEVVVQNR